MDLCDLMPGARRSARGTGEQWAPSLRTVIGVLLLSLGSLLVLRWLGRVAPALLLVVGGVVAAQQVGGVSSLGVGPGIGGVCAAGATLLASCLLALGARRTTQRLDAWSGGARRTSRPSRESR